MTCDAVRLAYPRRDGDAVTVRAVACVVMPPVSCRDSKTPSPRVQTW
jgi:hypothetical protein